MTEPQAGSKATLGNWSGATLASSLGVMISIPLLVVGVGLFMALHGQWSLYKTSDELARARFRDQTHHAAEQTSAMMRQASPLMSQIESFFSKHQGSPPVAEVAERFYLLMALRPELSWLSFGRSDAYFIGMYRDAEGKLKFTVRTMQEDRRTQVKDYDVAKEGKLRFWRTRYNKYDVTKRPHYKAAMKAKARVWSNPYLFFTSRLPGISYTAPYASPDQKIKGIISIDFNLRELSRYLRQLNPLPEGRIFVFSRDLKVIGYQKNPPRSAKAFNKKLLGLKEYPDPLLRSFVGAMPSLDTPSRKAISFRFKAEKEVILGSLVPCIIDRALTWYVGTMAPRRIFLTPAKRHQRTAILIAGVALIFALLLAGLFAWNLVRSRRAVREAQAAAAAAEKKIQELGSYTLIRRLGEGAMGEVWEGQHQMLARSAAIKLIRKDTMKGSVSNTTQLLNRFEREAQVTANLTSPHTVKLYDYGLSDDGTLFYVMELLKGLDLEELTSRHGPQSPGRTIHILRQVCDSLAEAHDQGLVHRDLKPANVFLSIQGTVKDFAKVLDFGVVHQQTDVDDPAMAKKIVGTPAFMAPEQINGQLPLDGRADIYALGCLGFWLLTARYLFPRDESMTMLYDHMMREPEPPSTLAPFPIPQALEDLIMQCLSKKPEDRPASAQEMAKALKAIELDPLEQWDEVQIESWWSAHINRKPSTKTASMPLLVTDLTSDSGEYDADAVRQKGVGSSTSDRPTAEFASPARSGANLRISSTHMFRTGARITGNVLHAAEVNQTLEDEVEVVTDNRPTKLSRAFSYDEEA